MRVFAYECISPTRRWQFYATRVLFFGALLGSLVTVWLGQLHGRRLATIGRDAEAGEKFFYGVVGTELTLLLLLAPTATAGAICVDKSRGTLAHVLVTDLTDFEIVIGKLAGRFLPVFALVAGTAPILFLGVLLGGIDPEAVAGSLIVMLGTALLGSAIALVLSVWARKTHEVLLGTFALLGLWLLAGLLWYEFMTLLVGASGRPPWLEDLNPYYLAFAAYRRPGATLWVAYGRYFAVCVGLSVLLATVATRRMRRVYIRQLGGPVRRAREFKLSAIAPRLVGWLGLSGLGGARLHRPIVRLLGPSLDRNPVLWREWHRALPSRFSRIAWAVYTVVAVGSTFVAIWYGWATTGVNRAGVAAWVNGLQVSVGLLLLSVSASTSLAEERDRGTLDVLLATPLSTWSIIWGKWWGTFRRVPLLAFLPTLLLGVVSAPKGNLLPPVVIACLVLSYGAFLTSLGLLVSTWVQRLGRTIAITMATYVLLSVGSLFLIIALVRSGRDSERIATVSPFMAAGCLTFDSGQGPLSARDYGWPIGWGMAYVVGTVLLFLATLGTFNNRLGRMPDRAIFRAPSVFALPPPAPRTAPDQATNVVILLPAVPDARSVVRHALASSTDNT